MEAFLAYNYQPYVIEGSPAAAEVILAEFNPKKRAGRRKFKETRHPVFRGIRRRNAGKWVCETREPNKKSRIWLGTFPTAEMAARAHDVASISLRGASACLNFADSAWRLPIPASGDTKDIQRAAAEAAELFRPLSPAEEAEAADVAWEGDMSWMDEEVLGMREILAEMYNGMMWPHHHQRSLLTWCTITWSLMPTCHFGPSKSFLRSHVRNEK